MFYDILSGCPPGRMATLRVGAAYPDPPCNAMPNNSGLDIDLMTGIAKILGATVEFIAYRGTDFGSALTDPTTGECDVFMKLAPVLTELVKPIPGVELVCKGISVENIAIAVPLADDRLLRHIRAAAEELEQDGTLQRIRRKWPGNPCTDQCLATG